MDGNEFYFEPTAYWALTDGNCLVRVYNYGSWWFVGRAGTMNYRSFDDWQRQVDETMGVGHGEPSLSIGTTKKRVWASPVVSDESQDGWQEYIDDYGYGGASCLEMIMSKNFTSEMSEVVDYMDDAYQGEWDSVLDYIRLH